jgi:hypothetical protein
MDKNQLVTLLLTKEEIWKLHAMCHDSNTYWYHHLRKAIEDSSYFLDEQGCRAVINSGQKILNKIESVYFATQDTKKKEDQEEEKIDSSLKVA